MNIAGCGWSTDNALGDHTTTTTTTTSSSGVTIYPSAATVAAGGTYTFAATIISSSDQGVIWRVAEANGGTITQAGVYTAPLTAGTYHVTATSVADGSKSVTASVTVASSTTQNPPINTNLGNAIVKFAVSGVPAGSKIQSLHFLAFLPTGTTVLNQGASVQYLLQNGVVVALGEAAGSSFFFPKFMTAPSVVIEMSNDNGFGNGEVVALYCTVPAGITDTAGITTDYVSAYSDIFKTNTLTGVTVIPSSLTLQ
jgi:hypothetical protein